ncbi:MAG: DUF4190 domain-containing protein [Clostridiales Family XIII bacterium]|jgi:hypothetical protein|nr:DUF4190 domain-containing protein [Clostridiales Family XIII bacterium]
MTEEKNKKEKDFDLKEELKEGKEQVKDAFGAAGSVANDTLNKANEKMKGSDPKSLATASFVLGIVAIVCIFTGYGGIVGVAAGIVGLVLGIKANKAFEPNKSNYATAGIIMSIIGLAMSALVFVACSAIGIYGCAAFNASTLL